MPIIDARASVAATKQYDYLIIGAGTAGLPAAIFAGQRGARVLLVDAAPDIGGTLHLAAGQLSGAGTRIQIDKGIVDTPNQHFDDIMRLSNGHANQAIARLVADNAGETINWLLDAGLAPLAEHPVVGDVGGPKYSVARYLWDKNQGRAILSILRKKLAPLLTQGQVTLLLNTRVSALLTDANGAVTGACVKVGKDDLRFTAQRTILSSGGYAMNPELFVQLIDRPAYAASAYSFSQGDGLNMALKTGAVLRGRELHRPGTGSILTSNHFPANIYARFNTQPELRQPWEIWVNDAGKRFVCEDTPSIHERERALRQEPTLRYRIIFDQGILDNAPLGIIGWTRDKLLNHFATHEMFIVADSLASLAHKIGVDAKALIETVREYNEAVNNGIDAFGRRHMPQAILKAPFYAITHYGHSATSSAGVVVDNKLRVLRSDNTPIKSLYAAGEVLGSGVNVGDAFVPGMMLTPALTLGRLLGQERLE